MFNTVDFALYKRVKQFFLGKHLTSVCYQTREGSHLSPSIVYKSISWALLKCLPYHKRKSHFPHTHIGCHDSRGSDCLEKHTYSSTVVTKQSHFLDWCDWNVAVVTHCTVISIVFRDQLMHSLTSYGHMSRLTVTWQKQHHKHWKIVIGVRSHRFQWITITINPLLYQKCIEGWFRLCQHDPFLLYRDQNKWQIMSDIESSWYATWLIKKIYDPVQF